jgi:hypothetical protein
MLVGEESALRLRRPQQEEEWVSDAPLTILLLLHLYAIMHQPSVDGGVRTKPLTVLTVGTRQMPLLSRKVKQQGDGSSPARTTATTS